MKDRIKQLMESQHMNQQSFASFLGLAPATLSSILQERTRPTLNTVDAICRKIPNVNLTWLMTGSGDMFTTAASENQEHNDQSLVASSTHSGHQSKDTPLAFSFEEDSRPVSSNSPVQHPGGRQSTMSRQQPQYSDMKNNDKQQRRITEIRVFYDDQTWESFVPKK